MAWGTKLMAWAPLAEGKNGLFAMQDKPHAAYLAKLTPGVEQNRLAPWTHNKTIQKAIESYRITPEQKEYLRTLKIK